VKNLWTNGPLFDPANASITGGTLTGTNVPYVLGQSGIPFIALSSGSVAANGAISGITALPRTYANAYCYFPANILATTIAAGWYYCTFSSATAGTAFLNTYSAGNPTIPASPTAVIDGKGAFTGVTGETQGPILTLPAGAMGPNGTLRIFRSEATTNSAGTKAVTTKLGSTSVRAFVLSTSVTYDDLFLVQNRGVQNVQVVSVSNTGTSFTASAGAEQTPTVDTSAGSTVGFFFNKNTATDNQVINAYVAEVIFGA